MDWLERLKFLKNTTNETYKSISNKTNIPQTTIEKLFNGRTKEPKLNMIRDIVHCLGYTLDDLISESKNQTLSDFELKIHDGLKKLNAAGQEKLLSYLEDLLENQKYILNNSISSDIATEIKSTENLSMTHTGKK